MITEAFFEQIKKQFQDELPFAAYRKPNTSQLKGVLQNNSVVHSTIDFTESGFVFEPFDSENNGVLLPFEISQIIECDFEIGNDFKKPNRIKDQETGQKERHINLVQKGIEAISGQQLEKVVLSRRETIQYAKRDPLTLFENLLNCYLNAFVYIWYHPKVGLWLGATPETLLSIRGSELKTMALAGTQVFQGTTEVIWKEKEKEEQQIVTNFIVESLKNSVGNQHSLMDSLKVTEQKTVKAGNLLHLQTEISMRLKPETMNLQRILKQLHPTPAVCGFPKQKAKEFILENEGYSREYYAGFMGELNLKEPLKRNTNRRNVENNAYNGSRSVTNLYVNLRCMQMKDETIYIYIGGGITKDSDPEAEWEETVQKAQVMKSVI